MQEYKIKIKFFAAAKQKLLRGLNVVFVFFSLRKTKNFWGIVYDSVTKQPLDPVIVKLLYTDGREIETCVTDLGGRYGFLAKPGKFKIFARKTNYVFPSLYAPADADGIYKNLYHGEFFELNSSSEVVAPNIPMDPTGFDWNQKAKKHRAGTYPYLELFFSKLIAVLFWFGLVICGVWAWRLYPGVPFALTVALVVYFIVLILSQIIPEPRLWGSIKITSSNLIPERFLLELHSVRFPGISFGKAQVHENGRFLLRAGRGKYSLSVSWQNDRKEKVFLGSVPVKISGLGVLNVSVEINEIK